MNTRDGSVAALLLLEHIHLPSPIELCGRVPMQSCLRYVSLPGLQPVSGWLTPTEHRCCYPSVTEHTQHKPGVFSISICLLLFILRLTDPEKLSLLRLINNYIKEQFFCLGSVVQLCQTDNMRGWRSNYTYIKYFRFIIVSYWSAAHPVSHPWHRKLKSLLTFCFSLSRKKWRGIIATVTTVEGKQFPRWRGKTPHISVIFFLLQQLQWGTLALTFCFLIVWPSILFEI